MNVYQYPTVYTAFAATAQRFPRNACFGWKHDERWRTCSYAVALKAVNQLAAGFAEMGVTAATHVALWLPNGREWAMSDLALNTLGAVSVPIHAIANRSLAEFIIQDSRSSVLIVAGDIYRAHASWIQKAAPLQTIIVVSDADESPPGTVPWRKCAVADDTNLSVASDVNALATLVYTSGTTGEPKGVMLTNRNLLANAAGIQGAVPALPNDRFLSFLPLSHAFERMAGHFVPLLAGAAVYYAEEIRKLKPNIAEVQPTVLIAVPKVFERMYERVFATAKATPLKKKLFFWSLHKHKYSAVEWLVERSVFRSIRHNVVGKHLRLAICGGAGIAENILKFFDKVGVRVLQGYGLTETAPVVAVNRLHTNYIGTVGQPLENVEVATTKDKEITVRGANVMAGYWHKPKATNAAIRGDWFYTGDLGFIDDEGFVTVIGRKKGSIVTTNGKNIAPEKIESMLNVEKTIAQSIVIGHRRDHLVALIVPEERFAQRPADEIRARIKRDVERVNKQLPHHEHVREFAVVADAFTMANEQLTPTLKLRRSVIEERYHTIIDRLYS